MIPLVGHVNELKEVRRQLEAVAQEMTTEAGSAIEYKFGTMIELPRAALTADQIAPVADFFSFGTNDLTQTTFGISRDDAEGKFLLKYVDGLDEPGAREKVKILPTNPFQTLDREGVGQLVRMAVEKGRKANPHLEAGHLRRARRRSQQYRVLSHDRPRLCKLLALPRAGGTPGGGAGRAVWW